MAKKENIALALKDVQDLGMSAKLKWKDCSIGKASNFELRFENDAFIDICGNFNHNLQSQREKITVGITKLCSIIKR